jgi:hypothetical protein
MKRSIFPTLVFILSMVFASGCAPASTPVPPTPTPLPTKTATRIPPTESPTPIPPTATLTPTPTPATPIVCVQVILQFNREFAVYPLVQQGNENVYLPAEEPTKFHDNFSLPLLEDVFFRCTLTGNDVETKASAAAEDKTIIEITEGPNGVIQMKGLKPGMTNVEIQVSGSSYTFTGILVETPK